MAIFMSLLVRDSHYVSHNWGDDSVRESFTSFCDICMYIEVPGTFLDNSFARY